MIMIYTVPWINEQNELYYVNTVLSVVTIEVHTKRIQYFSVFYDRLNGKIM